MLLSQAFFMYVFIKNGYGFEYVLLLVVFIHAAIFMQIKRHKEAGKTLQPFEIIKGYITMTTSYYLAPLTIAACYWMMSTVIHPVGEMFFQNNKDFVAWVVGLDLPGIRPNLDLSNPKNVLIIYFQTLAACTCLLSVTLGMLFLPLKIKDWRFNLEKPDRNKGGFTEIIRLFVFAIFILHFLTFYKTKYTFGYKFITPTELSNHFNGYTWALQIASWTIMGCLFTIILSGAIATTIHLFSIKKEGI